jgi:hypothetical protein
MRKLSSGHYEMDFIDLESKFHPKFGMRDTPSCVKAIVLCNPQNPIGRLWTREKLTRLGEIVIGPSKDTLTHCLRYKVRGRSVFFKLRGNSFEIIQIPTVSFAIDIHFPRRVK